MIPWPWLVPLFVAERTHQWASLLGPEAAGEATQGGARRFVRLALAAAFLEALALYVTEARVLWAVVFWTQVLHVAVTTAAALRRRGRVIALSAAAATVAVAITCVRASGPDVWSWFGAPAAFAAAAPGAAGATTALILFWILAHAVPCLVARLRELPRGRRLARGLLAATLATAEWWAAAALAGYPGTLVFPDLADAADLGREAGLWIAPPWTALFFAHVAVDFRRSLAALRAGPAPANVVE